MDEDVAKQILALVDEASARLNEAARLAQERCSDEEFRRIRRVVGGAMGDLNLQIAVPLFDAHPDLVPEAFRPWRPERAK